MFGRLTVILAAGLAAAACGKAESPVADAPAAAVRVAEDAASAAAPAAARDKILALAIAGECLRKEDLSAEAMAEAMLSRYRAHAITLATYTQEMRRLARDAEFRAALAAGIEDCAAVVASVKAPPQDADVAGDPGVADVVAPAPAADVVVEVAAPDGDVVSAASADGGAASDAEAPSASATDIVTEAAADAAPDAPLPIAAADVVVEAPLDVVEASSDVTAAPPVADAGPSKPAPPPLRWDGVYSGAISGTAKGTVRITIKNRRVASATAKVGNTSFTLKGAMRASGKMNLGARKGRDYVRIQATLNARKKRITGTWEGAVASRLVKGRVSAKR